MTREEAIQWLEDIRNLEANWAREHDVAIDMAIEALSADSNCNNCKEYGSYKCTRCDGEIYYKADSDLISRDDAINKIMMDEFNLLKPIHKSVAKEYIKSAPSANAVSRDVYDKRTQADEKIIDSYRHEFQRLLSDDAVMRDATAEERASVQRYIDGISTEIVQVVLCKDCRYKQYDITHNFCEINHHKCYDDDFCKWGERKEE